MSARFRSPDMSPEQYLEWESQQPVRYECLDGEVYPVTGLTPQHDQVRLNVFKQLQAQLGTVAVQIYSLDTKIQILTESFLYPDIAVSREPYDPQRLLALQQPQLIIEVSSPETDAYDRGRKFAVYRKLPSLMEYVLIDSSSISLECFRLRADGAWIYQPYGPDSTVVLESVQFSCPIATLYETVELL